MCDNNKKFIGADWKDDIDRIEKEQNLTDFEKEKVYFLNNTIKNYNSKISYFSIYKNTILHEEQIMNKDLMHFTTKEIEDVMMKIFNTSDGYKRALYTFLNKYFLYQQQVTGNINSNPLLFINDDLINKFNKKSLSSKYIDMESFHRMCDQVEKEDSLNTVIPVLLARYGITGEKLEDMRSVRFEDIDEDNMVINVYNENHELKQTLPIDNFFINKIKDYEDMHEYCSNGNNNTKKLADEKVYNVKPISLANYGYILKKNLKRSSHDSDIKENVSSIYNRFKMFSDYAEVDQRISPNSLVDSAKLQMLLEIRKTRKLTTNDIEDVLKKFNPDMKKYGTAASTLSKKYTTLTGETIYNKLDKISNKELLDRNGKDFVYKICANIGFWV